MIGKAICLAFQTGLPLEIVFAPTVAFLGSSYRPIGRSSDEDGIWGILQNSLNSQDAKFTGAICRIAGLNQNNTAKPDKPIKPTVKQNCFSKLFYGKHNFNSSFIFNYE